MSSAQLREDLLLAEALAPEIVDVKVGGILASIAAQRFAENTGCTITLADPTNDDGMSTVSGPVWKGGGRPQWADHMRSEWVSARTCARRMALWKKSWRIATATQRMEWSEKGWDTYAQGMNGYKDPDTGISLTFYPKGWLPLEHADDPHYHPWNVRSGKQIGEYREDMELHDFSKGRLKI